MKDEERELEEYLLKQSSKVLNDTVYSLVTISGAYIIIFYQPEAGGGEQNVSDGEADY